MLLESFSKGPRGFSYVFIITCKVATLEPIDGPTFVSHQGPCPCGRPVDFYDAVTFKVGLQRK